MPEPQRHVVVFDCNVYVDAARSFPPPVSWASIADAVVHHAKPEFKPRLPLRQVDSLKALAITTSGWFRPGEPLEIWIGHHIVDTVDHILQMSTKPDSLGRYGLGWRQADATAFVEDIMLHRMRLTGGTHVGDPSAEAAPPLDHEDGKVFGICREVTRRDPTITCYCVTNDQRTFIKHARQGSLGKHTKVITPSQFVALVQAARMPSALRGLASPAAQK